MEQSTTLTRGAGGVGRGALLAAGDSLVFLAFAIIGRRSHGAAAGLDAALEVGRTALPFILGWLIVAPLAGAYSARLTGRPGAAAARTALAWALALPVGVLIRLVVPGRVSPLSFIITTFIFNLALLCGWRAALAWWEARRAS